MLYEVITKNNGSPVYECVTQFGVQMKARPEIEIIAKNQKILAYWFNRFGLTPADRSRVAEIGDGPQADPLDEFGPGGGRITSYNVCYTKLLRLGGSPPGP